MMLHGGSAPLARVRHGWGDGARDLVVPPATTVPGLDLLRTVAVTLVISGHYYGAFCDGLGHELAIGRLPLFYFSWTGVDLFFVLSGYLIGRQLWRELHTTGSIDVPRFLLRRGLRIWPFYCALIIWVAITVGGPWFPYLHDLLFVSNYLRPNKIAGGWSLSTEEQFYICVPLLLLLLSRLGIGANRQFPVIVALLVSLPLVRALTLHGHPGELSADDYRDLIALPFHTHADALVAGVLISWLAVMKPAVLAPRSWKSNLSLAVGLALGGLLLRAVSPHLFGFTGLAMAFGGAVVFVLRDRSWFSRLARWRPFYVLSRLSYGMYLNHFAITLAAAPLFPRLAPVLGAYPAFLVGYLLCFLGSAAVCVVTFIGVEAPFLRLRDRWLRRRRAASAAARAIPAV
jgi:peptidoglycan/LPS O-acetylase OafA/YrhL